LETTRAAENAAYSARSAREWDEAAAKEKAWKSLSVREKLEANGEIEKKRY
jgi:hypothetical protein